VQPLKYSEQLVNVLHAEADTVITDHEDDLPVFVLPINFNYSLGAWTSKLERIGQQILEDLPYQYGIALHCWQISDPPFHLTSLDIRLQNRKNFSH
jgi:hypothetical protein